MPSTNIIPRLLLTSVLVWAGFSSLAPFATAAPSVADESALTTAPATTAPSTASTIAAGATELAEHIPSEYVSTYRFSGKKAEVDALREELDRVADQFNPIIRPIARRKLHQRIQPYQEVEFDRGDSSGQSAVRIHLGANTVLPCDGRWHNVLGDQNEKGQGVCTFDGQKLTTKTQYDQAVRHNVMRFSREGQLLRLSARLDSPKLPDSIRFELSYERSSGS